MQVEVGQNTFDVMVLGPSDAPAVLLLHGFPQSAHSWRLVVAALSDYRVVVPDQRGYSPGARPEAIEDYRIGALTADSLDILDALNLERAHVVGHDWGAAVAWQLGARHPERVQTLTAVSVPHPRAFIDALRGDEEQKAASLYMREFAAPGYEQVLLAEGGARFRALFDGASPDVDVEAMLTAAHEPGALAAWLKWYAAQRLQDIADTPEVSVPTMHVWSDGDRALRAAGAHRTAHYVTGPYRLETLHAVSHWVPEEAADQLAHLILQHLNR